MNKTEITIGVFLIKQENILSTDNNRNRWFLYKNGKPIGRYKNPKQAIKATKL
jgi:hypothetical protein